MYKLLVLLVAAIILLVLSIAYAGFHEGKTAYDRGDYAKAYEEFKPAANRGQAEAQVSLGTMYEVGKGVPKDYAEAMKWYRKAAEQGNARAQCSLGLMYELAMGVPQDHAEAVKWLRKAAEQGYADAQSSLGFLYAKGLGVAQDYAHAFKWYSKAANQGDAEAQYWLGALYHHGDGVPKDYAKAMKWYRKAAEQGHIEAQKILSAWSATEIPLQRRGGVYELPVRINGVITLKFILDSGASEVMIPADVALTLLRTGTIGNSDFLPGNSYELADGSVLNSSRLIIRELDLGGVRITQVSASIGPVTGSLLLGQSFLGRLETWSLDNKRNVLLIGGVYPR